MKILLERVVVKMKTIVLASNNKHKLKEFKEILKDYNIITLNDIEYFDDIEETRKCYDKSRNNT